MSPLLKLAERCEQAEGPDREIDAQVGRFFASTFLGYVPDEPQTGCAKFTASLDAAMTLVPEGCGWIAGYGMAGKDTKPGGAVVYSDLSGDKEIGGGEGYTVALALCAAALRARAATGESK